MVNQDWFRRGYDFMLPMWRSHKFETNWLNIKLIITFCAIWHYMYSMWGKHCFLVLGVKKTAHIHVTDCSRDSLNEYEKAPVGASRNGRLFNSHVNNQCNKGLTYYKPTHSSIYITHTIWLFVWDFPHSVDASNIWFSFVHESKAFVTWFLLGV